MDNSLFIQVGIALQKMVHIAIDLLFGKMSFFNFLVQICATKLSDDIDIVLTAVDFIEHENIWNFIDRFQYFDFRLE